MDYTAIFKGLNEADVRYLVSGAVALNLHGVPRLSFDLDLVPDPDRANVKTLVDLLRQWGYQAGRKGEALLKGEAPGREEGQGPGAVSFASAVHPVSEIDVAVISPAPFGDLRGRSIEVHLFGEKVPVISLEDLAAVKRRMGRPVDLEDLRGMEFLAVLREGRDDPRFTGVRREQMEKFQQWPAENRIDWLLTSSQLQRQMDGSGRGGGRGRGGLKRSRIKGLRHTDLS